MPVYTFAVYEVDSSYYYDDAKSLVLSKDTLEITDGVDEDLHRTVAEDINNDQSFDFASEPDVANYTVEYLDFAQINEEGPEFELYAMEVTFTDGTTKYYVMSKDDGFQPDIGDDLEVTTYSTFTSTTYGEIGAAVCFGSGAEILTLHGKVPIERLRIGDLVQTRDNGCQEVLWIGRRFLDHRELRKAEKLRPVIVRAGAFGNAAPLILSQQHRVLLQNGDLGIALDWDEAFIKAKHLAEFYPQCASIDHAKRTVCYYHVLLDRHEIIFANDVASESLFLGPMAIKGVSQADRSEIETLFPDLGGPLGNRPMALARPSIPRGVLVKNAERGLFAGHAAPPPTFFEALR